MGKLTILYLIKYNVHRFIRKRVYLLYIFLDIILDKVYYCHHGYNILLKKTKEAEYADTKRPFREGRGWNPLHS